jgi:O-antigen ligase
MNGIERVMTNRSTGFKVALAVVALIALLWVTGATFGAIWPIPVIVFVLWFLIQMVLRLRRRSA